MTEAVDMSLLTKLKTQEFKPPAHGGHSIALDPLSRYYNFFVDPG
jgi:hypothetical protein